MTCSFTIVLLAIGVLDCGELAVSLKTSNRVDESLGTGFDISQVRIGTSVLAKGATLFKPIPLSCVLQQTLAKSEEKFKYFENNEKLVKSFKVSGSLTPSFLSLVSLKTSLSATYDKLDATEKQVNGASRAMYSHSHRDYLDKKCRLQLDEEFEKDFKALKSRVIHPHYADSWNDYKHFVAKYGSHYVTEVTYGASATQYMSADATLHYTRHNFSTRACLELAAPVHVGLVRARACAGITKGVSRTKRNLNMNYHLVVLGGSDSTRNNVIQNPNSQNIGKLLNEGRKYESPIRYHFASIADFLMRHYLSTNQVKQAANLKSFIEGYVNFGCKYKRDKYHLVELQKFELNKDRSLNYPNYVCTLAPEGCRNNSDCHWLGTCKCHGDTCVRYEPSSAWFGGLKETARINNGSSPGIVNKYCKISWNGCKCLRSSYSNDRKIVWNSAEQGAKEQSGSLITSLMTLLKLLN